jgi:hypothetical protein
MLAVERDIADCSVEGLSPDWRLSIAYSAVLKAATAALAVEGFRALREQYHYRVIQSLLYTIKLDNQLIMELDRFRKKRNLSTYESAGIISDYEANRMIELAKGLHERVHAWLREYHPDLSEPST